jgi:hypothetical protein
MSLVLRDKAIARRKGVLAATVTAGSVLLIATGAPVLGALALIPSALLVKDWFMFRARRGMRF